MQGKLYVYFAMQKGMDKETFREWFVQTTDRCQQVTRAWASGTGDTNVDDLVHTLVGSDTGRSLMKTKCKKVNANWQPETRDKRSIETTTMYSNMAFRKKCFVEHGLKCCRIGQDILYRNNLHRISFALLLKTAKWNWYKTVIFSSWCILRLLHAFSLQLCARLVCSLTTFN